MISKYGDSSEMIPLPLLITGVAGVAGYNALSYFSRRYPGQVIGTCRNEYPQLASNNIVACNVDDRDGLGRLFDRCQFRSVLYCAGSCALKSCELDPAMAWRVNVLSVQNLLDIIANSDTRLVYLSIDLVFSGKGKGCYREADSTDPVTVYGKTMVQSERFVMSENPDACILRISLPMGISLNGHAGAIDWIQSRFKKSRPATLYFDEIRTPTYTCCLNRLCEVMLANRVAGLYHAGGPRRLSLYQIAQIVNRVGGYDPNCLHGCRRFAAARIPPRAGNVSLDSRRLARAVGYEPFDAWPWHDELIPTHREWHRERRGGWAGSPELLSNLLYYNPRGINKPLSEIA